MTYRQDRADAWGASIEPCAYCGARPTRPIIWTRGEQSFTVYLCAECDERESRALDDPDDF